MKLFFFADDSNFPLTTFLQFPGSDDEGHGCQGGHEGEGEQLPGPQPAGARRQSHAERHEPHPGPQRGGRESTSLSCNNGTQINLSTPCFRCPPLPSRTPRLRWEGSWWRSRRRSRRPTSIDPRTSHTRRPDKNDDPPTRKRYSTRFPVYIQLHIHKTSTFQNFFVRRSSGVGCCYSGCLNGNYIRTSMVPS